MESFGVYPKEENLGHDCEYWHTESGCGFPKVEMNGRRSCEGVIDDVCLFLKDGREAGSLTQDEMTMLKTRAPGLEDKFYLPPGGIT